MQKPLKSAGKKKQQAPNRHGKIAKTKKGRLDKTPKRPQLKKQYTEDRELSKAINATNESTFAGVAANSGGRLAVLKPPIALTADEQQRSNRRPGQAWGASKKK